MSQRNGDQTYYEVLEVASDAPHHTIQQAYIRAKEAYSDDSPAIYTMFTPEEAEQLRNLVEEAFLVLGDQTKRKKYDKELLGDVGNEEEEPEFPDFGSIQAAPAPKPSKSTSRSKSKKRIPEEVPDGFSKTKLSVYEQNPEIEEQIEVRTLFDGPFLQEIRMYKNVQLEQLSKETRVSKSYLAAIENNDFDALPAPVFVRGFIVQVARLLGLDEKKVSSSYMALYKSAKENAK